MSSLQDNYLRYGVISRALHWGMALLFAWQFMGVIYKVSFDLGPADSAIVRSHAPVGVLILICAVLRLGWWCINRNNRPAYDASQTGRLARWGHRLMYVLMCLIPVLALLRTYGSGRGFSPWGIKLMDATGVRIEWMMAPANAMHGLLGWLLLLLILGHVIMALAHRFGTNSDSWRRMVGKA